MVGEEVFKPVCKNNAIAEGAGKKAPLIQKGNFDRRPHLAPLRSWEQCL